MILPAQSRYPAFVVTLEEMRDEAALRRIIDGLEKKYSHFYLIPDYYEEEHAERIAPGVPVMIPCIRTDVRLVLKSGNFGQPDFFLKAAEMTAE